MDIEKVVIDRDGRMFDVFHLRHEGVGDSSMQVQGAKAPDGSLWERRKYTVYGMWTAWDDWKEVDYIPSTA